MVVLEAGTTFAFDSGAELVVGYGSSGALQAIGTATAPILLTSSSASPAAGDWNGLTLSSSCVAADTTLEHVEISYGGDNSYGNIYLYSCDATISDTATTDASTWGIYRRSASPTLSSITYSNNASGDLY